VADTPDLWASLFELPFGHHGPLGVTVGLRSTDHEGSGGEEARKSSSTLSSDGGPPALCPKPLKPGLTPRSHAFPLYAAQDTTSGHLR
jgi:hypothetical protein